jgi:hypothetical protein
MTEMLDDHIPGTIMVGIEGGCINATARTAVGTAGRCSAPTDGTATMTTIIRASRTVLIFRNHIATRQLWPFAVAQLVDAEASWKPTTSGCAHA